MKKLSCFILLFICIISISSCTTGDYGILFYQENKIYAECTVNEKYDIIITKDGTNTSLEISSPSELNGVKFYSTATECYVVSGDMKIPVSKDDLSGIFAIINIFSLDESTITAAKISGEQTVTFENTYGTYIMTFNSKGYPEKATVSNSVYNFSITINALKIE